MQRLNFFAALAVTLIVALPAPGRAQDPCAIAPLSAADLGSGPDALNAALACLDRRIRALEGAGGEISAAPVGESASLKQATVLETLKLSLDYASVVDKKQVLLEFGIENTGDNPVLAIVVAYSDSSFTLRGEAQPRSFKVRGIATCPIVAGSNTKFCIERVADETWTLLQPGVRYDFQIATDPNLGAIRSDAASMKIRLIVRDGDDTSFHDVPFSGIPLS